MDVRISAITEEKIEPTKAAFGSPVNTGDKHNPGQDIDVDEFVESEAVSLS